MMALAPQAADAQTPVERDPVNGPPATVSGAQDWRFLCTIFQCRQDYSAMLDFMARHARGASEWFGQYGFQHGRFSPSQEGQPVIRIVAGGDENQLGAYGRSDALIVLNERGGMRQYRQLRPEQLESPDGAPVGQGQELASTIGHEVFHGHHALLAVWDVEHVKLKWMMEGVAEMAGNLYLQTLTGTYREFRAETISYFADLRDPQFAYERGAFFHGLALEIAPEDPARVLRPLATGPVSPAGAGAPWTPDAEDDGIAALDGYLRSTSLGSLRTGYGRVIARRGNVEDYYIDLLAEDDDAEDSELPIVTRRSRDRREPNPEARSIPPFTSRGLIARVGADALRPPFEAPAFPGQEVVRVSIYATPDASDPSVGIAVENEWLDRETFERFFFPMGQSDIDFLARATNVAEQAADTRSATYQFGFDVVSLELHAPRCMGVGAEIMLDNSFGQTLRATRGRIRDGVYTAPSRPGTDVLEVEAYISKTEKRWLPFGEVDVRITACGVRMRMGEATITYDASTDATVIQTLENRDAYITASGYIVFDEEAGAWRRVSLETIELYAPGVVGRLPFVAVGDTTVPPQRLPLGFARTFEKMIENVKAHAPQMLVRSTGRCPTGLGDCTTYRVSADAGGATLVFDSGDRLVQVIDHEGEVITLEYSGFVVNPPLAGG